MDNQLADQKKVLRRDLGRYLTAMVSAASVIIFIELVLRVWGPLQLRVRGSSISLPRNDTIRNTYEFNTDKIRSPVVIRKNSLGFRGPEPPQNFSDLKSLIVVGGSTAACDLLSEGYTWSDHLYDGLKDRYNNIWINNAGINGHSTFGHLTLLQDYISKIKPNYILVLVGVNDMAIMSETSWDKKQLVLNLSMWDAFIKNVTDRSMILAYVQFMISKKGTYIVMEEKDYSVDGSVLGVAESYVPLTEQGRLRYEPAVSAYEDRLRLLMRTALNLSIKPILVTQPALYGFGIDDATGVDLGEMSVNDFTEAGITRKGRDKWVLLQMYNAATERVGGELGVPVIDLANDMPKSSKYYTDYIHFSEAGSQEVGGILLQGVLAIFEKGY